MKLLIDMNLTPLWVEWLTERGWDAVHWAAVGTATATDRELFHWAVEESRIVLTCDLDFGTLLALTHQNGPSVILLRGSRVLPTQIGPEVDCVLTNHERELASGALIVIDDLRHRVRILPL